MGESGPKPPPDSGKTIEMARHLPAPDSVVESAPLEAIPAELDRYAVTGLLGEGGMGKVYRATDPVLKRPVAIKVLHAGSYQVLGKFLAEARGQARVSHPNVAKVFEAGMAGDRPFIAMQLVEGRSLAEAAPSLGPRTLAEIMRAVADGIEAANRLGLVHRDIKPSNILLEEGQEGTLHPYVVDFGLVRDMEAAGTSLSGHTAGTPSFMAPEQASGDSHAIGPRTDVYGLGATLYAALGGRPPFEGTSAVEVMLQVINFDPRPLRLMIPSIPVDLATIVGKCMEKEPSRRYETAADVARDLGRFLAGEPIEARPPSVLYRLLLRARKNRLVLSVSVAALVALAFLGAYSFRERLRLREQAALAREFGQVVERLEAGLRQSYLLPPHDVRPARRRVDERIRLLEKRMDELGDVARAPGSYAIGKALLALGRSEEAITKLTEAWDHGYRPDEVAYALAVANARRYQEELANLTSIRNPALRQARRLDLQRQYHDPAVNWLRQVSHNDPEARAYANALLAFLQKRPDEAVREARTAFEKSEGFYEAKLLEAEVEGDLGAEEIHGGSFDTARTSLAKAEEAAQVAIRIGESDPATYETLCRVRATMMLAALYTGGGEAEAGRVKAVEACEDVLRVDPDSGAAMRRLGNIYRVAAEGLLRKGIDPGDLLGKALQFSRQAASLEPNNVSGQALLGSVWQVSGRREASSGKDPRQSFDEATRALEHVVKRQPSNEGAHNSLGVTWWYRAQWEMRHGKDPRGSLDAALRSLRRSCDLLAGYAFPWVNLGGALNDRGAYELSRGLDPKTSLAEAAAAFEKALSLGEKMPDAWNNAGTTWLYAADHARLSGGDPREAAAKALAAFDRATGLNPDLWAARFNSAQVRRYEAAWKVSRRIDPEPGLGQARETLEDLAKKQTFGNETLIELGNVLIVSARREAGSGRNPTGLLAEARKRLEAALAADANMAHGHRALAEAALVEARWLQSNTRMAAELRATAGREIEKAAALESDHVELGLLRKELLALREVDRSSTR